MQPEELSGLVGKIQLMKCEQQTVEVKSAHDGCPSRLYDTLSSFSNQDDGGVIIFGLDERNGFKIVGVYDVQDLQRKVTEQCKQMQPSVRPLFTVCEYGELAVVSAEIPSVDLTDRPVFYKGAGRIRGSYIRVGESDEPMSEYEIYSFDAFRRRTHDDLKVVENAKMSFFDQALLERYLHAVKQERKNIAVNLSDSDILELMGITKNGVPTLAGLLSFSHFPQANFPQLCITAVVVPGNTMGDTGLEGERFIANQRIIGPIGEMLDTAVDFVRRNGRTRTIIDEDGRRSDKPEFPTVAVREAILNALVHRDYSSHTETVPIRIVMYSNRMEIINSGGLYGRITIDSLGKVHPDTRNPTLANILELLNITENRYSGIPTIRKELKNAGLPAPIFAVNRGEFIITFKNNNTFENISSEENRTDAILEFCKVPRSREELVNFMGFSQYYTMSKIVKPLVDDGQLFLTVPEKPRSRFQRYFSKRTSE